MTEMSHEGAQKRWERLVREYALSQSEQELIHRHLARSYYLEKDYMSYEELKAAAREVVSRVC